jgi:hypothetical protein
MTNEFRIVAMVFGLSTSSALAQDVSGARAPQRRFPQRQIWTHLGRGANIH